MERRKICVYGATSGTALVWEALARLLPVTFEPINHLAEAEKADALILLKGGVGEIAAATHLVSRCFAVLVAEEGESSEQGPISFSQSLVDRRLRGRTLPHEKVQVASLSLMQSGAEVLARRGAAPVWLRKEMGRSQLDAVAVALPELTGEQLPFEYLRGNNFIRLLPLLHFLREVVGDAGWKAPPLRACFMFDDPNLHGLSYGFVTYSEILRLALSTPFHVAFAMVPLDGWYADARAARLFREHPEQLSLLIHGNDHLRRELALFPDASGQLSMLAQARRRIHRFEEKTRVAVAKVMAPPHGAFHRLTPAALFSLGFDGAFISPWSLQDWGLDREATPAFGLDMAEVIPPGLPCVPRFRLSADCEGSVVMAAFLDQPIVPVGHHDTLSDGPELLSEIGRVINSLGSVTWTNPQSILETNCASSLSAECLRLRPASAAFSVDIPDDVTSVVLEPTATAETLPAFRLTGQAEQEGSIVGHEAFKVRGGTQHRFSAVGLGATNYQDVSRPGFSPWASTRRLLCEVRDRSLPIIKRLDLKSARRSPVVASPVKLQPFS